MLPESKEIIDPDRMLHLEFTIGFKPCDLPCHLCCLPVGKEYPVVEILTQPGGDVERYCQECYRCLWIEGHHFIGPLPNPDTAFEYEGVTEPNIIFSCGFPVPCFLVKRSGLQLFKPTDPAEISQIRAANLKLREEDLDAPEEAFS